MDSEGIGVHLLWHGMAFDRVLASVYVWFFSRGAAKYIDISCQASIGADSGANFGVGRDS
jgi:hypothetical protein